MWGKHPASCFLLRAYLWSSLLQRKLEIENVPFRLRASFIPLDVKAVAHLCFRFKNRRTRSPNLPAAACPAAKARPAISAAAKGFFFDGSGMGYRQTFPRPFGAPLPVLRQKNATSSGLIDSTCRPSVATKTDFNVFQVNRLVSLILYDHKKPAARRTSTSPLFLPNASATRSRVVKRFGAHHHLFRDVWCA
jgi:hypothetical protein